MDSGLHEVKVHVIRKPRRQPDGPSNIDMNIEKRPMSKVSRRSNDYAYENNAFTGSVNSVSSTVQTTPPTSVIREQYWACSKWPRAQRVLAITVGVLGGAVIGLAISVGLLGKDGPHLGAYL